MSVSEKFKESVSKIQEGKTKKKSESASILPKKRQRKSLTPQKMKVARNVAESERGRKASE